MLDELLDDARNDDNVLGIVVFGSRGKGAFVGEPLDGYVNLLYRSLKNARTTSGSSGSSNDTRCPELVTLCY